MIHYLLNVVYALCIICTGIALEALAGVISLASSKIDHSLVSFVSSFVTKICDCLVLLQ